MTELGAWRDVTRNLIVAAGDARPVQVAEITASGFRIAAAAPLMGRVLVAADEHSKPWYEVVGVVKELGMGAPTEKGRAAGVYLPAASDRLDRVYMIVHVRGDPI